MALVREVQSQEFECKKVKLHAMHAFFRYVYSDCTDYNGFYSGKKNDLETFKTAANLLYVILTNTYDDQGDRKKILDYVESKSLEAKEDKLKVNFYQQVSGIIVEKLKNKTSDQLHLNFPELTQYQCHCIYLLVKYICNKFYDTNGRKLSVFFEQEAYKFNTAYSAIMELYKPSPDFYAIERLLKNYKIEMDKHSFFKKHELMSDKGKPGDLRYILLQIVFNKTMLRQEQEEKPTPKCR